MLYPAEDGADWFSAVMGAASWQDRMTHAVRFGMICHYLRSISEGSEIIYFE